MSHPVLLTDLPDEVLLRISTCVADLLDFECPSEKPRWNTQTFGPLKLPVRSLIELRRISHRFNRLAEPLLFRTLKITGWEEDGSVSVVTLLHVMLSGEEDLGRKVKCLWLGPWKPSNTYGGESSLSLLLRGLDIHNRPYGLRSVAPLLPYIERYLRRNVVFLDPALDKQLFQQIKNVEEDALLALLLSMLPNLTTLDLVPWLPSFLGQVYQLLVQWTMFYNGRVPRTLPSSGSGPFSKLTRVTFHEYCWGEDYSEHSGSEGWSDHEDEVTHEYLTIHKLVPFFQLPSMRVLECRKITSRGTGYDLLDLPVGCSGIEELSFNNSSLDDRSLQAMIAACKGMTSFHFQAAGDQFGYQPLTSPGLGQALETQSNTLTKLSIRTGNVFFTNNGRDLRDINVGTIGSSLVSLTKLRDLEVPGTLLWGYHPEAVSACEIQKNSPLFIDLSPFANLTEILPRSLERLCVDEWYKNIDKSMEDFARCCGDTRLFGNMNSLEVGLSNTKVLEEICEETGVQLVERPGLGTFSPNRPR
ncbi:hypothetical protein GLAREA_00129 [Glarea lozoyensis ATCC 20868]|uniref:Uncharacterized protein n=1 Tax=Glarea lozoyensis (strain ATCC 20868 / MF5171) TaxID=1116229 RepID=S3DAH0_GLAL2|nr:uncharacterized protein GLAREA_00129 [Glarea lozoyensis ATCC 20868]EPE28971.1 hypothetical protein GLAREA_00129 [Glarea lozoyensis ATCC 20868]